MTTQRGVARSQRDSKERCWLVKDRGRATIAFKVGLAEDIILENGNVVTMPMQAIDGEWGEMTIMQVTRRSLLKSGILASAGHVAADNFPLQRDADAAISASRVLPDQSGFEVGIEDPVSPGEHLLLDFGWRLHLGMLTESLHPYGIEYSASSLPMRSHD
jgi:hypothetical protein